MLLTALLGVATYSQVRHVNPAAELRTQVTTLVGTIEKSLGDADSANPLQTDELRDDLLVEIPSAILVFALVLVWANLVVLLRLNPRGLRERLGLDLAVLRRWKAPEWLVWPTIVAGGLTLLDRGWPSDVALNAFKFLMAVYAIQGLSILAFFFDVWNVRGLFRSLLYVVAVMLMMPLLLSLGFFDLWFDFRGKLRQS
jgi:uncharacterized protein YybS (DUF2232 family)